METWERVAKCLGNKYMVYVVLVGNLLSVLAGMTFAWTSPALLKLRDQNETCFDKPMTDDQKTLLSTLFSIGGAAGPVMIILASKVIGRRAIMSATMALFSVTFFILAFSKTVFLYLIMRTLQGCGVSVVFGVMILYIGEISSVEMRGTYMSFITSAILFGSLLTYCIGPYVSLTIYNLIIAILALVCLPLFHFTCPETLYHTMKTRGAEKTLNILKRVRGRGSNFQELESIRRTIGDESDGSLADLFKSRAARKALAMSAFLLVLQQFSGINVVLTYRQSIFEDAKMHIASDISAIIVSGFQVMTCFITPLASKYIDRKPLLMFSLATVALSNILLGLYFQVEFFNTYKLLPLIGLICYVISYNCGAGSLPWVFLGELFPVNVSSIGTSICNIIYWLVLFLITFMFEKLSDGVTFFIFGGICFVSIFIVQIFLIETRGQTFQEIQNSLQ